MISSVPAKWRQRVGRIGGQPEEDFITVLAQRPPGFDSQDSGIDTRCDAWAHPTRG